MITMITKKKLGFQISYLRAVHDSGQVVVVRFRLKLNCCDYLGPNQNFKIRDCLGKNQKKNKKTRRVEKNKIGQRRRRRKR